MEKTQLTLELNVYQINQIFFSKFNVILSNKGKTRNFCVDVKDEALIWLEICMTPE